ncbi:MAG: hypothetical protein IKU37_00660 [Candidatus Gastranaerophilales bacterium]|nr:hypothetical protein [Candidatus Gastranaerophilales bacterium]
MDKDCKNTKIDRQKQTEQKLNKMRNIVYDQEKCKEIAQKLCAYISKNS